jgi:hypothetical protein
LGNYPNGAEYSNWLFFRYVAEQNGGTNLANGGEDIMQRTWENIAAGQHGLVAYNNALTWKNPDTGLAKVFHQYAIATRFMKSGPTTSPYHFEEASEYLAYSGTSGTLDNQASLTTLGTSHAGTIDDHYALNWIGLPDQGTYDIVLENTGTGGEFRGSIVADMGAAGVEVTPLPVVAAAGESSVLSSYTVPTGAISVVAVLTNQHQTSDAPATCNANPYQLTVAEHDPGQDSGPVTVFLPYVRR